MWEAKQMPLMVDACSAQAWCNFPKRKRLPIKLALKKQNQQNLYR
jgi:hypothetical protein